MTAARHLAAPALNGHGWHPDDPGPAEPMEDTPWADVDPAEAVFEHQVQRELLRRRVREEVDRRLVGEDTARRPPRPVLLSEFLAVPDEPVQYRIEGLLPVGGRALLAAQYKAGKSTAIGNLLRSLVDGDPFLGSHHIAPPEGRVVLIDDELDQAMLRRWLREQGIRNTHLVAVVPLRGRLSSFNIVDASVRREWADALAELDAAFIVLDCLRPIIDALGLSEDKDSGRVLVAFDELLHDSGATEAVVVHHMGHQGERSRGDSRLRDWPDVEWTLVRKDTEDPASARFFRAFGRDVDLPESELAFDPAGRRLTIIGGSRKDAAAADLIPTVLELLPTDRRDAMSGRKVEAALVAAGEKQKDARAALKLAVARGHVNTEPGPRGSTLHWLADPSASVRRSASPVRQRGESECVSASIGDALTRTDTDLPSASADAQPCTRCRRPSNTPLINGRCRPCAYPAGDNPDEEQP